MANTLLTLGPESAILGSSAPGVSYTTGNVVYMTLDYDQTTNEYAYFYSALPQVYGGGDLTLRIYWTATATGDVKWRLFYYGVTDDEVLDQALSANVSVVDSVTAANDLMVATATITSPALAAGDFLVMRFGRMAPDPQDTLAADAKLLALSLEE